MMAEAPGAGEPDANEGHLLLEDTTLQPTADVGARDESKTANGETGVTNDEHLVDSFSQKLDNDGEKLDNFRLNVDSDRENVESESLLDDKIISSEEIQEQENPELFPEPASREALSASYQTGQALETVEQEDQQEVSPEQTSFADSTSHKDTELQECQPDNTQVDGTEVVDRLTTSSRQNYYEDAVSCVSEPKDVPSTDGDSIQMMDIQSHSGTTQDCERKKICDLASDENKLEKFYDEDIGVVPIVMEEVKLQSNDDSADNNATEDRINNKRETDSEKLKDSTDQTQINSEGQQVLTKISEQTNLKDAAGGVPSDQQDELKTQIKVLQERLEIVIKENQEKSMKIVTLEGQLLEMTAKLRDTEKKVPTTETSSRPDIAKSKTCTVL